MSFGGYEKYPALGFTSLNKMAEAEKIYNAR